jgi:hypothetical protein
MGQKSSRPPSYPPGRLNTRSAQERFVREIVRMDAEIKERQEQAERATEERRRMKKIQEHNKKYEPQIRQAISEYFTRKKLEVEDINSWERGVVLRFLNYPFNEAKEKAVSTYNLELYFNDRSLFLTAEDETALTLIVMKIIFGDDLTYKSSNYGEFNRLVYCKDIPVDCIERWKRDIFEPSALSAHLIC